VVAHSSDNPAPPWLTRSMEIRDSGMLLGRIEISRSLRPFLLHTGLIASLGLLLGAVIFATLRLLPLRALSRAQADNIRLLEESERRIMEQEALIAVATAVSRSLRLDELLQIVLEKVQEVTGRERVSIRLKSPDTGEVTVVAHLGFSQEEIDSLRRIVRHKITDQVFATGKPVVINSRAEASPSQPLLPQSQSVAWIPITSGAKVVGVLGVAAGRSVPFSPREVNLLQAIGDVIGVAIENARLFDEAKRNAEAFRILSEVSQNILTSQDLKTTLQKILEETLAIGPYDLGAIRLVDAKTEMFEPVVSRGYQDPRNVESHRKKAGDLTSGRTFRDVMSRKAARVVEQVQQREGLRTLRKEGIQTAVLVPLCAEEEILGVLHVGCRTPRKFLPEEVHLLETIGKQIGIAVQKARLAQAIEENLEGVRALYEIGTAASSTLERRAVLDLLMRKINLFLPYSASLVWLRNKETGLLERTACWNLDQQDWMGRQLKSTPTLVREAVESKAPVVVKNLLTDPRTLDRDFYRRHGLLSYLGVPLVVKEEVLGVLVFLTREEHEFTRPEVEFLTTLASQAAMAIHNSQLHEQTMHQAQELEKANKVKDEFLGFVSHELRTPLNVVIAYTIMMQDRLLGEVNVEQEKTLGKMLRYSKDLLDMINSLLEVTRIQAGRVEVDIHRVDLRRFVDDLKAGYDAPIGKPITLQWEIAPDLPEVRTDGGKLRHILQNLITNSIKYTEKGTITISARFLPVSVSPVPRIGEGVNWGRGVVEFAVADTGLGIPQESLPFIFEMFRQVNRPDRHPSSGAGLGLHIVKKFTEMLGGKIEVKSEVAKGSTFTVAIPLDPRDSSVTAAVRD